MAKHLHWIYNTVKRALHPTPLSTVPIQLLVNETHCLYVCGAPYFQENKVL